VYARDVESYPEPLTFGVSGKLIMNVLVMYDRQTESYWSQMLGQAVEGELAGAKLTPLASLQTTWAQWKAMHPGTQALRKGYFGARDPYTTYFRSNEAGVLGETLADSRLPTKALGLGFRVQEQAAFFPYAALIEAPLVNAVVAGEPVLVAFRGEDFTGAVFHRQVAGQTLTFTSHSEDAPQPLLSDAETGSVWRAFDGVAIAGPLAGTLLERIPATSSFWFGWKDWYPDTYLYQP